MPMYKKVLVPLDGSELAECTLSHVLGLAKGGQLAEITLLRVVEVNLPRDYMRQSATLRTKKLETARIYLEDIRARLKREGIETRAEVIEGENAAQAIGNYAEDNAVDLIILAGHGQRGLKKLVFGSVARKVLEDAQAPVLILKPAACLLRG